MYSIFFSFAIQATEDKIKQPYMAVYMAIRRAQLGKYDYLEHFQDKLPRNERQREINTAS